MTIGKYDGYSLYLISCMDRYSVYSTYTPFYEFDKVHETKSYKKLTTYEEKKLFGIPYTEGQFHFTPKISGYITHARSEEFKVLYDELNVNFIMLVDNEVDLVIKTRAVRFDLGLRKAAHTRANTNIDLFEKGKGLVYSGSFKTKSNGVTAIVDNQIEKRKDGSSNIGGFRKTIS